MYYVMARYTLPLSVNVCVKFQKGPAVNLSDKCSYLVYISRGVQQSY